MTNKFDIKKVTGRAKVVRTGQVYSTYIDFAKAAGYPDAAVKFRSNEDSKKSLNASRLGGEIVNILAKGKHGTSNDILYVVENAEGERFLFGERGLEIIGIKEEIDGHFIDMSYDQLVEYSAQVFKEVRRRAYGEGYRQGKFDAEMDANENKSKTPEIGDRLKQAKRDHIVAQSKADLEYLKGGYKNRWYQADGVFDCEADFIVNREKRTVVVLLRGVGSGVIRAKGIAKCAPNDCFNVHIGKAIALRRALGLKVPSDYLNAPQPTEVRVGDVLEYEGYRVTVHPSGGIFNYRREGTCSVGSYVAKTGKIIDDSLEV